jgi:maltose alpha-D-glucosyltransferase/alpha-amylase
VLEQAALATPAESETWDDAGVHDGYWLQMETLARRVGELHRAFALEVADPAFAPEATTAADITAWNRQIGEVAARARDSFKPAIRSAVVPETLRPAGERLLDNWHTIEQRSAIPAAALANTVKTRIHGDLHLGQTVVAGLDFYILDFEGEPLHSIERRRAKCSPLRDVAGMIRSFDYAAHASLSRRSQTWPGGGTAAGRTAIARWRTQTTERFIAAYRSAVAGCASVPQNLSDFSAAVDAFILEKALYELWYEVANRPDWLGIPLAGIERLLGSEIAPS